VYLCRLKLQKNYGLHCFDLAYATETLTFTSTDNTKTLAEFDSAKIDLIFLYRSSNLSSSRLIEALVHR